MTSRHAKLETRLRGIAAARAIVELRRRRAGERRTARVKSREQPSARFASVEPVPGRESRVSGPCRARSGARRRAFLTRRGVLSENGHCDAAGLGARRSRGERSGSVGPAGASRRHPRGVPSATRCRPNARAMDRGGGVPGRPPLRAESARAGACALRSLARGRRVGRRAGPGGRASRARRTEAYGGVRPLRGSPPGAALRETRRLRRRNRIARFIARRRNRVG